MVQNTKNSSTPLNPIVSQILDILGEQKEGFDASPGTYRDQIDDILKNNKDAQQNKELALYLINEVDVSYFYKMSPSIREDKNVALAALALDSSVFRALKPQFQVQLDFGKAAIKSMVRERVNFLAIHTFMKQYFTEVKIFEKLFKFYKGYLKIAEYLFHSDIEKQLIEIRTKDEAFFDIMVEKQLLEQKGKKTVLSQKFVAFFLSEVSKIEGYSDLSPEEKNEKVLEIFAGFLGLPKTDLSADRSVFLLSVVASIHIKKEKKSLEEKDNTEEKNQEKEEKDSTKKSEEADLEDRLDFCLPHCNYSVASDGGCDIQLGDSVHVHLSEQELETINNTALQNYIEAVKVFQDIGLGFVLNHKKQFFSTICGVDYLHGEGLSEARMLKILNKVGKKIDIPEKAQEQKKQDDGEKTETKVGCFSTHGEAIYQFRQIRNSGNINGKRVVDLGKTYGRSVVEIDLIEKGFFDREGKGFQEIPVW